jgi:type IV pilus biogenesis protein CpaD/CtpE
MNTENQPVIVTGCSNEANLDAMVANPADLAGGRPLPPAMGEATALANQRYNEGKVPPLPGPIVTTSQ